MPYTPSEFEEKEFEAPLYNQISVGNRLVWSPGQVFENHIGIDHAVFLEDPRLWRYFMSGVPLPGAFLHRYHLDFAGLRRRRRRLPNFRLNLFIQAKRSFYHNRRPRHLLQQLNSGSCWRFDVVEAQQEVLEKLAKKLESRALVCYAAPAFHRLSQLYALTADGTIVANSTFPPAKSLSGHRSFYYQEPGGKGVANAQPEIIEGPGLEEMLRRLAGSAPMSELPNALAELKLLGEQVFQVVSEDVSPDNPRRPQFFEFLREYEEVVEEFEGPREALQAFARVAIFANTFNCQWYVVSEA
jgi:hypothetical protein